MSLTGTEDNVDSFDGSSAPSSSLAASQTVATASIIKTQAPSVVTEAGQTVVVTAPGQVVATAVPAKSSSSGGPNKAAIAAGVVVGVVFIAALVAALFFYMRWRKQRAAEEEYRRNMVVQNYVSPGKAKSEASADSRLDPSITTLRRFSDGSIADERDFSRRILQVCSPSLIQLEPYLFIEQVRNPDGSA